MLFLNWGDCEGGGREAASLQGQLIHPLDHVGATLAPVLTRPRLQAVLQLPAELLASHSG